MRNSRGGLLGTIAIAIVGASLLPAARPGDQIYRPSPSEIVQELTHPPKDETPGILTCGTGADLARRNDFLVESLVKLGTPALPAIEQSLRELEKEGPLPRFWRTAAWLLRAYAEIRGPAAFPRLRRIITDPRFDLLHGALADAIAVAFGLTSYVSWLSTSPEPSCSPDLPRSALDRLIVAWFSVPEGELEKARVLGAQFKGATARTKEESSGRARLERCLGPDSKSALQRLLEGTSWESMRARLWPNVSGRDVAVGYRFVATSPEFEALFVNRSGTECGTRKMRIATVSTQLAGRYVIETPDLEDLLRVISSCAAAETKR